MKVNKSQGQLTYQIDVNKNQKNGFPIPCDFLSTGKMGIIYPTQALEVTYGDKIINTSDAGVQLEPLAVPIMANMFIKQEHYYTPYDCVWEHWDDFISGGEELDFNTPPPTFTMQRVFTKLFSLLPINLEYRYKYITSDTQLYKQGSYLYMKLSDTTSLKSTFAASASTFAQTYGVADIFKHFIFKAFYKLCDWMDEQKDYFNNLSDSPDAQGVLDKYFVSEDGSIWILIGCNKIAGVKDTDDTHFIDIFAYDYKDKYYDELVLSLNAYDTTLDNHFISVVGDDPFYLTEKGYALLSYMYKVYKPFIGVGSYIDNLNIQRYTEKDMFYLYMCSILKVCDLSGITTTVGLNSVDVSFTYDTTMVSDVPYRALDLRVLYLIWYNNYRDQLLEKSAMKPNKSDTITDDELVLLLLPRVRCWEKDSYTTALDNPATADAVIPVNNSATNRVFSKYQNVDGYTQPDVYYSSSQAEIGRNQLNVYSITDLGSNEILRIPTGYITGLSLKERQLANNDIGSFSLHILDAVQRAQKFFQKALYFGNRIQDFIFVHWGVSDLNARLKLPELLSTSSSMAQINTLVNNTTTAESVAGDRSGLAYGEDKGGSFSRFCEESGVIMSLFTLMPQPTYAFGTDKKYSRLDRFDYPFPDFATLGMDAVYDSELVSVPNKVSDGSNLTSYPKVFGYQGRYYDTKFRQSTEHGELLTTQDMYTFGRRWNMYSPNERPLLNYEFVHCFPDTDMFVLNDKLEDIFRFDVHHDTMAELTLPYHSIYL